jgi:small-conductance mechanosensitive channel
MRLFIIFFLSLLFWTSISLPSSFALSPQEEITPTPQTPPSSRRLDKTQKESIELLIKRIESKQMRHELLSDLRTLLEAENRLEREDPSAKLGLVTISNGLHSITSKIIEFFDELQHALERLSKYLKDESLKEIILTTTYQAFGLLLIGLAIDSGLKFLHMPLRRLFIVNARKEHLSHQRLILNVGIFEGFIIAFLMVLMLSGLSTIKPTSLSALISRLIVVNLGLYLIALHMLRTLLRSEQKLVTIFYLNKETRKLTYYFLRFLALSTSLGIGIGESITLIGGPSIFYASTIKSMLLLQCIFTAIFVMRVKEPVRSWLLSSNEQKQDEDRGGLSYSAARTWHLWALIYIFVFAVTIYFQTINNMKEVVISFGATALLVSIAYLLVLKMPVISDSMMDKIVRSFPHMSTRHGFYSIFSSLILGIFIIITVLYCAFKIWDIETVDFLFSDGVKPVFTTLLNIFFIMLMGALVWEANEYLIQQIFKNEARPHRSRARRQRLATMMPLVQIIARGFILGIFIIMAFSELKLDVTPLLAGLGVIGIAFSFGSQSLVKDFITGIFILIEDTMNVGDIVQIEAQKGTVETLSLRTVKLRDTAGNLHTIPFSTINRVINMTKNFAYYVVEVTLSFEQDLDPALQAIKEVDEEIRLDPNFKDYILSPIEMMGVDRFAENGVVVMARVKTVPDKHRWDVGREFNLRIQRIFNERKIEFSTTPQKILITKS